MVRLYLGIFDCDWALYLKSGIHAIALASGYRGPSFASLIRVRAGVTLHEGFIWLCWAAFRLLGSSLQDRTSVSAGFEILRRRRAPASTSRRASCRCRGAAPRRRAVPAGRGRGCSAFGGACRARGGALAAAEAHQRAEAPIQGRARLQGVVCSSERARGKDWPKHGYTYSVFVGD